MAGPYTPFLITTSACGVSLWDEAGKLLAAGIYQNVDNLEDLYVPQVMGNGDIIAEMLDGWFNGPFNTFPNTYTPMVLPVDDLVATTLPPLTTPDSMQTPRQSGGAGVCARGANLWVFGNDFTDPHGTDVNGNWDFAVRHYQRNSSGAYVYQETYRHAYPEISYAPFYLNDGAGFDFPVTFDGVTFYGRADRLTVTETGYEQRPWLASWVPTTDTFTWLVDCDAISVDLGYTGVVMLGRNGDEILAMSFGVAPAHSARGGVVRVAQDGTLIANHNFAGAPRFPQTTSWEENYITPFHATGDGRYIYACAYYSGEIWKLDTVTGVITLWNVDRLDGISYSDNPAVGIYYGPAEAVIGLRVGNSGVALNPGHSYPDFPISYVAPWNPDGDQHVRRWPPPPGIATDGATAHTGVLLRLADSAGNLGP